MTFGVEPKAIAAPPRGMTAEPLAYTFPRGEACSAVFCCVFVEGGGDQFRSTNYQRTSMKGSYAKILAVLCIWLSVNVALIATRLLANVCRSRRSGTPASHASQAHLRLVSEEDWRPPIRPEETAAGSGRKPPST